MVLVIIAGISFAQGGSMKIPENARTKNYGSGWECDRGYRQVDEICTSIKVPPNAYLNPSGDDWKCDRGYRKVDEACIAVKVPENGYFVDSSSGPGWRCDWGYRKVDEACAKIEVPENARLNYLGWECIRPYRQQGNGCTLP